jgi:hypothetical protein
MVEEQVQRHLQLRIEAQGKYLQSVLEKALAKQTVLGLEEDAASFKAPPELLAAAKRRQRGVGDGSVDSCLTACERDHHDMLSIGLCTTPRRSQFRRASEEYVFLGEPSRGASSNRRRCEIRGLRTAELDLSINNTCRTHDGDKIDLNGSSWN